MVYDKSGKNKNSLYNEEKIIVDKSSEFDSSLGMSVTLYNNILSYVDFIYSINCSFNLRKIILMFSLYLIHIILTPVVFLKIHN